RIGDGLASRIHQLHVKLCWRCSLQWVGVRSVGDLCGFRSWRFWSATAWGLVISEFLGASKKSGHAAGQAGLGVDQEVAVGYDPLTRLDSGDHREQIVAGRPGLNFTRLEHAILFRDIDQLARAGIENGGARYYQRILLTFVEHGPHEHAGAKAHSGIGHVDVERERPGVD